MNDLLPGYVDLQVNGYAGVDFNSDDLTADTLLLACQRMRAGGVGAFLATIITEDISVMCARLRRLAELRNCDPLMLQMISGFHIEGPFINETPGYVGAHPPDAVRPATVEAMQLLLEAAQGLTRLVTLAPERDAGAQVTRLLAKQNILVAAGHCDPTLDQLAAACDAGLRLFTHLGNGCPGQMPRHDNVIQRALSLSDRLVLCFIADGVHVPLFALKNYIKAAGIDRCVVVTDAIAAAGLGPGRFRLSRWDLLVGEDLAARAPDGSHLVGSAMTMSQSKVKLQALGLVEDEILSLVDRRPRDLLLSKA